MTVRWLAISLAVILGLTVFGAPAALAAAIYRVDENFDAGWHQQATTDPLCGSGAPTGGQRFEAGPAGLPTQERPNPAPPRGTGSLEFRTGSNGPTVQRFRNHRYEGTKISDIVNLSYWTYVDPESDPIDLGGFQVAVSIVLRISTTGDGNNVNSLTFEPAYQGAVERGEWQRWDAASPSGRWYLGNDQTVLNMKSLAAWSDFFGDKATIVNDSATLGGVILSAGCGTPEPWANFVGNTDDFTVRLAGEFDVTVYDMEPPLVGLAEHLECEPETSNSSAGTAHVITCTATNAADAPVNNTEVVIELTGANDPDNDTPMTPDLRCTTDAEGECSVRHGPGGSHSTSRAGTTTYRAWIDEDDNDATTEADLEEEQNEFSGPGTTPDGEDGDNTDVVEKTWSAARLDCVEESVTLSPGSANTITCTASDTANTPVGGAFIDIEATGVNDPDGFSSNSLFSPDFSCETGVDGKCAVTHGPGGRGTTSTVGRTTYRAWIDADNRNTSHEADTSEGRDHTRSPGNRPEIDQTDVVEAEWSSTGSSPSPTPTPTTSPSDCPTPSPSPTGASPSPSPTGTPCPTPTPTPTPTPSQTASPSPTPTTEPHGCAGDPDAITGTPGNDVLRGTDGDDTICGFGGDDTLIGRGGNDLLIGGDGNDILRGNAGDDALRGSRGEDTLQGGAGSDLLVGGVDDDILRGGGGSDILKGRSGKDVLRGRGGNDRLLGHRDDDGLFGGRGRDRLNGGAGTDTCRPGDGRDRVRNCE